jgi:uncharacterized pyridoxamine 5'-phosphate oxidase family protein
LKRGANFISSNEESKRKKMKAIIEKLEEQREAAYFSTEESKECERQIKQCRNVMIHVTKA